MKALIVATTLIAASPTLAGSIPSVLISGGSNAKGVSAGVNVPGGAVSISAGKGSPSGTAEGSSIGNPTSASAGTVAAAVPGYGAAGAVALGQQSSATTGLH
jgi:hypothetical protein